MTVFEDELHDMTSTARELIPDVFGVPQEGMVEEFPYGTSFPYRTDIAGVDLEMDVVEERSREFYGLTPVNTEWRFLNSYLYARRLSPLSKSAWLDESSYRSAVEIWDWLTEEGFIQFDTFAQPGEVRDIPLHGDQWAFELKPRDWEKALEQAERAVYGVTMDYHERRMENARDDLDHTPYKHGGYADYCVVIMDADHVDEAIEHLDEFEEKGVGLASLDRDDLEVHLAPERQEPRRWSRNRLDLNERTLPEEIPDA